MFQIYGMPYIWNTQTFINSYWIVNAIKLSLKDQLEQAWHISIQIHQTLLFINGSRKH